MYNNTQVFKDIPGAVSWPQINALIDNGVGIDNLKSYRKNLNMIKDSIEAIRNSAALTPQSIKDAAVRKLESKLASYKNKWRKSPAYKAHIAKKKDKKLRQLARENQAAKWEESKEDWTR